MAAGIRARVAAVAAAAVLTVCCYCQLAEKLMRQPSPVVRHLLPIHLNTYRAELWSGPVYRPSDGAVETKTWANLNTIIIINKGTLFFKKKWHFLKLFLLE